ncbi:MAG: hypothetical protein IT515_16335 [Burkholderiales bacterium]|nr:hypothetical protein [Burkholderiales bacterium]
MCRTNSKLLPAVLAAILLAGAPLTAGAQSKRYAYRAELAENAKRTEVRAAGVVWRCHGKVCVAHGRGGNVSVRGCTELARQVGRVVGYRSEIKHLADDQLAACNAEAAAGQKTSAPPPVAAPAMAAAPVRMPRVVTEELTFTGVHASPGAGSQ